MSKQDKLDRLYELTVKVHEGGRLDGNEKVEFEILLDTLHKAGIADADIEKALDMMYLQVKVNKALRSIIR